MSEYDESIDEEGAPHEEPDPHTLHCWPRGQPPVKPWGPFGPFPLGPENHGILWRPEALPGYIPRLERFTLQSRNATSGIFVGALAPEWYVGFIDPENPLVPNVNGKFIPAAGLRNPIDADLGFFAAAGAEALVRSSNNGAGWDFPARSPEFYWPLILMAHRIGGNVEVDMLPIIKYVRDDR